MSRSFFFLSYFTKSNSRRFCPFELRVFFSMNCDDLSGRYQTDYPGLVATLPLVSLHCDSLVMPCLTCLPPSSIQMYLATRSTETYTLQMIIWSFPHFLRLWRVSSNVKRFPLWKVKTAVRGFKETNWVKIISALEVGWKRFASTSPLPPPCWQKYQTLPLFTPLQTVREDVYKLLQIIASMIV